MTGFPKWGRLVEGQFRENGQKLHENYKSNFLGGKAEGETWGGQTNFSGSGGDPPQSPSLREILVSLTPLGVTLAFL